MTMGTTTTKEKTLFEVAREKVLARIDSWVNPYTGYGTARDKTAVGYFDPSARLLPEQWIDIYEGDAIAGRIVDTIPDEMLRQGFALEYERDDEAELEGESVNEENVREAFRTLEVAARLKEAMIWGRCTGGALVLLVTDDGAPSDKPLVPERVRQVVALQVYDRSRIQVARRYSDQRDPKFGQPEVYRIDPIEGQQVGDGAGVHETRCIRFGGAMTSERTKRELDGWDLSVLQRAYEAIRKFHEDHKVSSLLMSDASQGVWKMAGFLDMIAAGLYDKVQARLVQTEIARGAARAIVVDPKEGEDFTKVQNAFSGVADMLDRAGNYLAAATGIPVTILMGQAPAGLNATGDSDIRLFYDRIRTAQQNDLEPVIMRLVEVVTAGRRRGWKVSFNELWQETRTEKADRQLKEAQRDVAYLTAEVVTPEEVALSPHLDDVYPTIDRDMRRELLEEQKTAALETPAKPAAPPAEEGEAAPAPGGGNSDA